MAGDVTQKDLQSLQGFCNKKIAELQTQIDKLNKSLEAFRTANNVVADEAAKANAEVAKLRNEAAKVTAEQGKALSALSAAVDKLQQG